MKAKFSSGTPLSLVQSDWSPIATVRCDYRSAGRREDGKYVEHDTIPHLCHIEMTYACNEKCIFCYNPERAKLGDLSAIDRIVQSVAESEIPHVYLIGGEPSLLPVEKLNEYIELLAEHSSVTIVTNGLQWLKGISSKLACFGVPIHGANAETHEFLNQSKGSFKKTLQTIRRYVGEGHDVRCIPVLTGYNYDQMYDIIGIAASLGMESIYVDRYEDGYSKWLQEDREHMVVEEEVYDRMAKQYKEVSGANFGGHVPQTKEQMMGYWSKPEYSAKQMMGYDEACVTGRGPVTGKTRKGVRSPEQLIDEMKAYRDYMGSKEYRGREPEDYENKITDDVYGFHRVAQGAGLAALESGDIRTAAKALAFAQSVEEMSPEALTRVKEGLSKLDESKRKEFVIAFESAREKPKETK